MQPGTVNNVLKTLQQMMLMARECKLISELPKIKKSLFAHSGEASSSYLQDAW
jgi:hypothetical protein